MPHVALGSHYEEFVRKQLESGRFSDASEVVRAGLRLLEDLEQTRDRWIDEEIPARYDDIIRDPALAVSAASVRTRFDAKRKRDAEQAE